MADRDRVTRLYAELQARALTVSVFLDGPRYGHMRDLRQLQVELEELLSGDAPSDGSADRVARIEAALSALGARVGQSLHSGELGVASPEKVVRRIREDVASLKQATAEQARLAAELKRTVAELRALRARGGPLASPGTAEAISRKRRYASRLGERLDASTRAVVQRRFEPRDGA